MNEHMKSFITVLLVILLMPFTVRAEGDSEAALLLDLKKTRADYEVAKQKFQNDTKLYNEKAISANDFNRSKNELLSKEVDYQKLILKLISQQSYITVERAVKYQDQRGERKVKITLKSALEGNEEFLRPRCVPVRYIIYMYRWSITNRRRLSVRRTSTVCRLSNWERWRLPILNC